MRIKEGDEVRNELDGERYLITRIVNRVVLLRTGDPGKQAVMVLGLDYLDRFFKKMEEVRL